MHHPAASLCRNACPRCVALDIKLLSRSWPSVRSGEGHSMTQVADRADPMYCTLRLVCIVTQLRLQLVSVHSRMCT